MNKLILIGLLILAQQVSAEICSGDAMIFTMCSDLNTSIDCTSNFQDMDTYGYQCVWDDNLSTCSGIECEYEDCFGLNDTEFCFNYHDETSCDAHYQWLGAGFGYKCYWDEGNCYAYNCIDSNTTTTTSTTTTTTTTTIGFESIENTFCLEQSDSCCAHTDIIPINDTSFICVLEGLCTRLYHSFYFSINDSVYTQYPEYQDVLTVINATDSCVNVTSIITLPSTPQNISCIGLYFYSGNQSGNKIAEPYCTPMTPTDLNGVYENILLSNSLNLSYTEYGYEVHAGVFYMMYYDNQSNRTYDEDMLCSNYLQYSVNITTTTTIETTTTTISPSGTTTTVNMQTEINDSIDETEQIAYSFLFILFIITVMGLFSSFVGGKK